MSLNEETPPLLDGGLPPPIKLLTAAFLLYSSSTSRLCLFLMNRYAPPAMAARTTIPITTPAAIPALLGPEEDFELDAAAVPVAELLAVTTTVCPPTVTTDAVAEVVEDPVALAGAGDDDEEEDDEPEPPELVTSYVKPVRYTL